MALVAPAPIGFERSTVPGAGLEDLDLAALATYLRQRSPALAGTLGTEGLAARLGLRVPATGGPVPTIAALLAFGTAPQLHRPEWGVSAILVAGHTLAYPIVARADLEGDLPTLLAGAMDFVRAHARAVADLLRPGGLPAPLPLDELAHQGGLSMPRNPLLAAVARGLGLCEQVGRGLPVIRSAVASRSPTPGTVLANQFEVRVVLPSALGPQASARLGN